MITALIVSPTRQGPLGPEPKVDYDFTLSGWRVASAKHPVGSFASPPGEQPLPTKEDLNLVAVEITCEHDIWEALILDPEYGTGCVYWYQEDGHKKRVLRT